MSRGRSSRRVALAIAAAAIIALCGSDAAGSRSTTQFDGAQLAVDSSSFGGQSLVAIDVQLQNSFSTDEAPGLAAYVDVTAPEGYKLDLSDAPGTTIGQLIGTLIAADGSDSAFALGTIDVDDPAAWAADPVAQACAPGAHAALWHASPTVLGRAVNLPIAVDAVPGTADPTYVIRICTSQAASTDFPKGIALESTGLLLPNFTAVPNGPGTSRWSALVTPASPGSLAPQPSAGFELRAVERRPNVLTLHARYEPRTNTIAIGGKVAAAGAPWANVQVALTVDTTGGQGFPTQLGAVPTRP